MGRMQGDLDLDWLVVVVSFRIGSLDEERVVLGALRRFCLDQVDGKQRLLVAWELDLDAFEERQELAAIWISRGLTLKSTVDADLESRLGDHGSARRDEGFCLVFDLGIILWLLGLSMVNLNAQSQGSLDFGLLAARDEQILSHAQKFLLHEIVDLCLQATHLLVEPNFLSVVVLDLGWDVEGVQILLQIVGAAIVEEVLLKLFVNVLSHLGVEPLVCTVLHHVAGHILEMAVLFAVVRVLKLVEAVSVEVEAGSTGSLVAA